METNFILHKEITDIINNFYNKKKFMDKYGIDLYITLFIILIFFILITYYIIINNIEPIKNDWVNQRCNPSVMPFAGLINAPDGENKFNYTSNNFYGCINNILNSVASYALQPIYYILNIFSNLLSELMNSINAIRNMFYKIRSSITNVTEEIFGRALNITIPITELIINFKDMMNKSQAIITSGLYTLFGSYLALKSLMGVIYGFVVAILITLAAIIVVMFATFNFGAAAAMTVVFVGIATPLAIIAKSMKEVFHLSGLKKIPKKPHCFDENTEIKLFNSTKIKISELKPNMKLFDGSYVTAVMKLSTEDHILYNLKGVIVTGTHLVFHKIKGWISVKEHPDSIIIDNYIKPFIYCIGTSNKIITINSLTFADWDEINEKQINELRYNAKHILPSNFKNKYIHKYIDSGFTDETYIELNNGNKVRINNIEINTILKHGERVLGIVKLDAKKMNGIYEYNIENIKIKGGDNLYIRSDNLGVIDTSLIKKSKLKDNIDYLYNLITDKRIFHINNLVVCDYNSCLEKFMNNDKNNILLSTII